jgi:hypothetical protein
MVGTRPRWCMKATRRKAKGRRRKAAGGTRSRGPFSLPLSSLRMSPSAFMHGALLPHTHGAQFGVEKPQRIPRLPIAMGRVEAGNRTQKTRPGQVRREPRPLLRLGPHRTGWCRRLALPFATLPEAAIWTRQRLLLEALGTAAITAPAETVGAALVTMSVATQAAQHVVLGQGWGQLRAHRPGH